MPEVAAEIQRLISSTNPYTGFRPEDFPSDTQGGQRSRAMAHVFAAIKPRLLVEVGTWKGASACFWAKLMRDHGIDGAILCVDTWLGGLEHLLWENEWNIRPYYRHGYPALFYQFLANVMRADLQDYIVPLPTTSLIGARWMRKRNLVADVIYIDGSHDEDDVYNDLREFWQVLRPGGVMCGDDFSTVWYSVICAVNRFAKENHIGLQVAESTWILQKP